MSGPLTARTEAQRLAKLRERDDKATYRAEAMADPSKPFPSYEDWLADHATIAEEPERPAPPPRRDPSAANKAAPKRGRTQKPTETTTPPEGGEGSENPGV